LNSASGAPPLKLHFVILHSTNQPWPTADCLLLATAVWSARLEGAGHFQKRQACDALQLGMLDRTLTSALLLAFLCRSASATITQVRAFSSAAGFMVFMIASRHLAVPLACAAANCCRRPTATALGPLCAVERNRRIRQFPLWLSVSSICAADRVRERS
jgi:hypothetical protein